jgi:hypothetical protein
VARRVEARGEAQSVAELLVDGEPNLVQWLPLTRKSCDELSLLTTRHAPDRLTTLEAAQQRAMIHALIAPTDAVDAVEYLRVCPSCFIRFAYLPFASELRLRQHVLTRNAGPRLWVRKSGASTANCTRKRDMVAGERGNDGSSVKEKGPASDHASNNNERPSRRQRWEDP